MSNPESFLSEVADEMRRDRMYRLWRRYGPWVIGAIVLVVAGGAAWEWRERMAEDDAQSRMEEYLVAAEGEDAAESAAALAEFAVRAAEDDEAGYAIVARLRAGARLVEAGDTEAAAETYRALANDAGVPQAYRELAGLRALLVEAVEMSPSEVAERLEPLTREGETFRLIAGELRVNALLAAGDWEAAASEAEEWLESEELGDAMEGRVREMRRVARERLGIVDTGDES